MSSDTDPAARPTPLRTHTPESSTQTPRDESPRLDTSPAVRYLTRRCGDRQLAEDIAQDALVTILTHDSLHTEWRSLQLLFRVALNEYSNHRRKALVRSAHLTSVPAAELSVLPESRSFDVELAIDVRDALARMEPEQRRLVLLYWEGYSYAEMASETDTTVGALRMRLKRAKEAFIDELAEYRTYRKGREGG